MPLDMSSFHGTKGEQEESGSPPVGTPKTPTATVEVPRLPELLPLRIPEVLTDVDDSC